jgi:hypothetical protein
MNAARRWTLLTTAIRLHHGRRIRWRGGPCRPDPMSTLAAGASPPPWFMDNGYPSFQDGAPGVIPPFQRQ